MFFPLDCSVLKSAEKEQLLYDYCFDKIGSRALQSQSARENHKERERQNSLFLSKKARSAFTSFFHLSNIISLLIVIIYDGIVVMIDVYIK